MKKAKVTRKPSARIDYTLRPSRWRMMLIYSALFTLALVFGLLLRMLFGGEFSLQTLFGDWYVNIAIVIGGAVLYSLLDYRRWTMRVLGGDQVEGPTGALGDRVTVPIREIDWTRSRRSIESRIKIGTAIYSLSRQRILISPWFYDPDQFREFLDRIGYESAPA